jgi:major histocompatibility complex class I
VKIKIKNNLGEKLGFSFLNCKLDVRLAFWLGVVAHAFNPSTWEAEAGGFLSSRPAWSTE